MVMWLPPCAKSFFSSYNGDTVALVIFEKALGPEHPDVVTSLNNLARLYRTIKSDKEAEALEKRAASIRAIQR